METKLANKLLRCVRPWECDPLLIPHGMAQSSAVFCFLTAETCGRAVSVGGVIQTTDHVERGARHFFQKKKMPRLADPLS